MLYCHSVHFDYAVINYAVVIVGNNEAVKRAKDTKKDPDNRLSLMPCVKGFEPSTYWSVASRSIQLSYTHTLSCSITCNIRYNNRFL